MIVQLNKGIEIESEIDNMLRERRAMHAIILLEYTLMRFSSTVRFV